ncbi:hypothetical protein OOJ91_12005 [Micromonospora lupini]|uniref:hypothetical protein n=1 Tax=Micromonospora lupini TaxID=285679 RepID=UPI002250DDCE|nr:hypothetical protein [Micromonospora lupini]MCX5066601.1 hypothetical protein [Micromonospora lupini]
MADFLIGLVISAVLTLLIKGGFALAHQSISWVLAAIIAVLIVFGGWVVFVDTDGSCD